MDFNFGASTPDYSTHYQLSPEERTQWMATGQIPQSAISRGEGIAAPVSVPVAPVIDPSIPTAASLGLNNPLGAAAQLRWWRDALGGFSTTEVPGLAPSLVGTLKEVQRFQGGAPAGAAADWWKDPKMLWWQDPTAWGGYTTQTPTSGTKASFFGTMAELQDYIASLAPKKSEPIKSPTSSTFATTVSSPVSNAAQNVATPVGKVINPFAKQSPRITAPMTRQMGGGGVNPFHAYGEQW